MALFSNIRENILLKMSLHLLVIEAVEIREEDSEQMHFNALLLSNSRGKVSISDFISSVGSDKLSLWISENVNSQTPVIINCNSDKIIHKIIDNEDSGDNVIKELIPNGDLEKFHYQLFPLKNGKKYISIIRKNSIEDILQQLSCIRNSIISVSISPFFILDAYKMFFHKNEQEQYDVYFENYHFLLQNDNILVCEISPYSKDIEHKEMVLATERISTEFLLSYSCAVHFYMQPFTTVGLSIFQLQQNHGEYVYRKLGKVYAVSVACLVLFMLILSSVFFSIYQSKYQKLESKYFYNNQQWGRYQKIKKQEQKRVELLRSNGLIDSSDIAYYADQVSFTLPESLYLRRLEIHPINTRSASENIDFAYDKIIVEGNCYSSNELYEWVNELKTHKWIKNIIIKNYKQGEYLGMFTVEITKLL